MNDNSRNSSDSPRATLREHLLARHAASAPQLDALRQSVLSTTLARHTAEDAPVPISQLLRVLFLPHRRVWTTLAATWLLVIALHLSQRSNPASSPLEARTAQSAELARNNWLNQQAQLHALLR